MVSIRGDWSGQWRDNEGAQETKKMNVHINIIAHNSSLDPEKVITATL